jgi:hypothetical protein
MVVKKILLLLLLSVLPTAIGSPNPVSILQAVIGHGTFNVSFTLFINV